MVTVSTRYVFEGVCCLDDFNLLPYNRTTHIFQKALLMILLKVKGTLMNLWSPMIGTKVLLALTLKPEKTELLLTTFVSTPRGLRITHFTAVTTMNEGVCVKFSDACCDGSYVLCGDYDDSYGCCVCAPHS